MVTIVFGSPHLAETRADDALWICKFVPTPTSSHRLCTGWITPGPDLACALLIFASWNCILCFLHLPYPDLHLHATSLYNK